MKKIILLVTAFIGMNSLQAQEITPSIAVVGEGVVKVTPDQVLIKVRVESEGSSAQQVKSDNDKAIDKVLKYTKSMGVKEGDVKTEYVNLNKNYDYQTKEYKYVANQSISILLKDLNNTTINAMGIHLRIAYITLFIGFLTFITRCISNWIFWQGYGYAA